MQRLHLRSSLAAVLIAGGCAGGATVGETDLAVSSDGLGTSPEEVDFGVVELGHDGSAQVQLTNMSPLAVMLRPRTVTAGFTLDDNCGVVLRGRASCTINVHFAPAATGEATGTLTVASRLERHDIPLIASGGRRVTVSLTGAGHVTSTPAGIDCGTTCSAVFAGEVTLTATADAGGRFVGWGAPCGTGAACVLPADATSVSATFASAATHQVTIAVAGDAAGFVYLQNVDGDGAITQCAQPCTVSVPTGRRVFALGFTPSRFGGWIGCAVPPDDFDPNTCDLGEITTDVTATVTFHRDEREVATLFPPRPVLGLAFTPEGDVLIADPLAITRMTLSGTLVWSVQVPGGAHDIVTDAAGRIYGSSTKLPETDGGVGLFALDHNGNLLWARNDITVAPAGPNSFQSAVAVSPDGSVIAAHLADGVQVVDGNGVDRFAVHGVAADGLAVAADGTVALGKVSKGGAGLLAVARYTAQGVPLGDLDPVPGSTGLSMTYDAAGALVTLTTGDGNAQESVLLPDSTVQYTVSEIEEAFLTAGGVAVDSLGDSVFARWVDNDFGATGVYFEVVAPGGLLLWTHEKGTQFRFDIANDGVAVRALATDAHRHLAFGGAYNVEIPWVQIYEMPARLAGK